MHYEWHQGCNVSKRFRRGAATAISLHPLPPAREASALSVLLGSPVLLVDNRKNKQTKQKLGQEEKQNVQEEC